MAIYCRPEIRVWMPAFMRVSRTLMFLLIGPLSFFIFMALILDGYFEERRYIYCFPKKSYPNPFNHTTERAVLWQCGMNVTRDHCSCLHTTDELKAQSGNNHIVEVLPPGRWHNVSLGFVPGSTVTMTGEEQVPWIGVIAVGIGFLISLVLNIRHWVEFMKTNGSLDGVVARYYSMLFSVGPGAGLLHLLLVYLTFAAVALRPDMKWTVRLLPALLSAVYLGLSQFNLLFSLMGALDLFGIIAMVPMAAVSIFGETQIAVAMSHLEGGLDQQWQISLTPMWILGLLMFLACVITMLLLGPALCTGHDDLPRAGDIVAYGTFGITMSIFIACTLMMACHNENTWDRVRQKGHYSWLAVMVPLMLLVGGYLVMQVVDIVGDCIVRLVRCHLGLRNKARMYRKQAIERDNHLAGSGIAERSDNDVADVAERRLDEVVGIPDATEGYSLDVTKIFTQLKIYRNPEMGLIALSSLRNHLTKHPNERTNALKKEILELCRVKQEDGNWSKQNAAVLREILSLFTQLGALLEQTDTSAIRTVEELDKPQPPMMQTPHR